MLELNSNYRDYITYRIYIVIGMLMLLFSFWTVYQGHDLLGASVAVMSLFSLFNALFYFFNQRFYINPVLITLFYTANLAAGIAIIGLVVVFWTYPTMLALYWIHTRRVAQHIVPIFFAAICFSAIKWLPVEYSIRITVTLFLLGVFLHFAWVVMEKQYQEVTRLSITDHLTGAYNRRYMDSKIDELIERQKRAKAAAAMINLDVDHFKSINDHFGHSSGDKVLVEIVKLLKSRLRVLDKVCRAGGEEFVILLPDTTEQAAYSLAEDIRHAISESNLLNQSTITISCGIASLVPGDNRDSWLKRSDQALYKAKEEGRNRVVLESTQAGNILA